MKQLIAFFTKQGLFANLLTLFVIIGGLISSVLIQREVFPNVQFDLITISTLFPGATPSETEKLVTNKIESSLTEVDGIKELYSASTENRSLILAKLDPDETYSQKAKKDIQDAIDRIEDLPDDAEEPLVTAIESKHRPIIEVSFSGSLPEAILRKDVKKMKKILERLNGIAQIAEQGVRKEEIHIEADPKKLASYQLSLLDLIQTLQNQNQSVAGGTIERSLHKKIPDLFVRTTGEFQNLSDIQNTVIRANALGQTVRIQQVAHVSWAFEKASKTYRTNAHPAMSLIILKKEKADAIDIVDRIKRTIKKYKNTIDHRIHIHYINDLSYYIRRRMKVLKNNFIWGLLLILLVLSLLLPFRVALVVLIGIPFSLLATMILFYWAHVTLNLITLMGLIIVLGMLVDDAVVVTENAYRIMEEKKPPIQAAIEGAQQMVGPVTASVLTTILAFLPLMSMGGIMGKFIKYIPLAVIVGLLMSLFECFFILPHHVSLFVKPESKTPRKFHFGLFFKWIRTHWQTWLVPYYLKIIRFTLKHRYGTLCVTGMIFIGCVLLARFHMRFVLFPPNAVEIFLIKTEAPTGTALEKNISLIKPIEKAIQTLPKTEVKDFTVWVGQQLRSQFDIYRTSGSEFAQAVIYLTPSTERKRSADEIINELRKKIGHPPGLKKVTFEHVQAGPPVGKPIHLTIQGEHYKPILKGVHPIIEFLKTIPGVKDIQHSYFLGKPELQLIPRQKEAKAAHLSVKQIGLTVRSAYEGVIATKIPDLEDEINLRVLLPKTNRQDERSLQKLMIPTPQGTLVPLPKLVTFKKTQSPSAYEHQDHLREVHVTAEVDPKQITSYAANQRLRHWVQGHQKAFPNLHFSFGGEEKDTQESLRDLKFSFLYALMGIILILVLIFQNLAQAFLVVLTIPLGIMGVILAFFMRGMPLSFLGLLGTVALSGVIVNNAIVFIDFVNKIRKKHMFSPHESILQAAKVRIRPIVLTSITTVFGILPTAHGLGGMDPFVVPIATALGWGLLVGSFFTVLVFPSIIAISDDIRSVTRKIFSFSKKKNPSYT